MKLKTLFQAFQDPFAFEGEGLISLISQTVMPNKVVRDLSNLTNIRLEPYKTFAEKKIINSTLNLWSLRKKVKLNT